MANEENTPLLSDGDANGSRHAGRLDGTTPSYNGRIEIRNQLFFTKPEFRLLFAGLIIATSFYFTQVPILYGFHQMICEEFYRHAEPLDGTVDQCSRKEIDAGTARQLAILGVSSVFCGVLNLFITGTLIRKRGPRFALAINMFFPVLRATLQGIAIGIGSGTGVMLFQLSQLFGIPGGPAGYILVLNTAIVEVVEAASRTASFGKLQGAIMFGTAIGYVVGGLIGQVSTIRRPFDVAAVCQALCCLYCVTCVPYIDPKSLGGQDKMARTTEKSSFFLKVLLPQRLRLEDGRTFKYYGMLLLALGIFISVVATAYAPTLIQMYAMEAFHFEPTHNSALMAINGMIRGVFLMFIFPHVITYGRRWFAASLDSKPSFDDGVPTSAADLDPIAATLPEEEPSKSPSPVDRAAGAQFDLWFLRFSLLADATITGCIAFASQSWHIYLAGFLLPFASGAAPASRGVFTEMCSAAQRPDAIQAMTFVEYVSVLVTLAAFGLIYSAFASVGKAYLTFFCNAAVALIAIAVLLFAELPPQNSVVEQESETSPENSVESRDSQYRRN